MLLCDGSLRGAGDTRPPAAPARRSDAGMVLLETALAIPLLLLVALAGLGIVRLGVDELAVVAAARDGAIHVARGEGVEAVSAELRRRLPGAEVATGGSSDEVWVSVRVRTSVVPMIGVLSVGHQARATAAREPGA